MKTFTFILLLLVATAVSSANLKRQKRQDVQNGEEIKCMLFTWSIAANFFKESNAGKSILTDNITELEQLDQEQGLNWLTSIKTVGDGPECVHDSDWGRITADVIPTDYGWPNISITFAPKVEIPAEKHFELHIIIRFENRNDLLNYRFVESESDDDGNMAWNGFIHLLPTPSDDFANLGFWGDVEGRDTVALSFQPISPPNPGSEYKYNYGFFPPKVGCALLTNPFAPYNYFEPENNALDISQVIDNPVFEPPAKQLVDTASWYTTPQIVENDEVECSHSGDYIDASLDIFRSQYNLTKAEISLKIKKTTTEGILIGFLFKYNYPSINAIQVSKLEINGTQYDVSNYLANSKYELWAVAHTYQPPAHRANTGLYGSTEGNDVVEIIFFPTSIAVAGSEYNLEILIA